MRFRKALISFGVASALAVEASLFSSRQAEAQSSRPYVVFVNGWQNCCAWDGMLSLETRLINEMNAESRRVPYSTFREGDRSNSTENDSAFLREGADFINNKLERNRPLVLIGHSFGGDSVLKLLPRINRRIQFVAVLDPVSTGGFRSSLSGVPSNVDYFFNRWQDNLPFPTDFKTSGSLQCSAKTCDQVKQKFVTDADSKVVRHWKGRIRGWENERSTHQGLPMDPGVQKWLGNVISEVLARNTTASSSVIPQPDEESNRPRLIPLALYWNGQREDNSTVATLAMRRSQEQSGYAGPNIQGCILSKPETGTIPLLLFWHPQREDNVTVATDGAIQSQIDSGYGNRAVQGYIYSAEQPGTIPLLLFWHPQREDNATVATKGAIRSQINSGYGNPAIQGYIYPADKCSR